MNGRLLSSCLISVCLCYSPVAADDRSTASTVGVAVKQTKGSYSDVFRQLEEDWPTPNGARLASGAPGPDYWQQQADYRIRAQLDEAADVLTGEATITYTNHSPHELVYLWLHLDQNRFRRDSAANRSETGRGREAIPFPVLRSLLDREVFDGGMKIVSVRDAAGSDMPYTIVGTQMRIDLPAPLAAKSRITFSVRWTMNVTPIPSIDSRAGVEQLEGPGRKLYTISQWYPRLTAYTDAQGWHIQQFLGTGEFTLEYGDFDVELTVPADHVVSATGELQNPQEVLSETQRDRLALARTSERPLYVVKLEDTLDNEKEQSRETRTWRFAARNVRDFAFASSRSFIWQAWAVELDQRPDRVMVMAFFPRECSPLWDQYAVHATAQAIEVYSKYSVPYPYPVINTVNFGRGGGMEYPMITFNGGRVDVDDKTGERTYSRRTKDSTIGVIIHETGHQFFPMVVNSDERQWMWMDEGINSFLESIASREWEENAQGLFGPVQSYMASPAQLPIMTQPDQLTNVGANAYDKPTAALTVLREVVLGRELFDFAFREYARRWKFKRPTPPDFFRTMEDASGVDLDWFWRGWFYTTDHVDIAIDDVRRLRINTRNPDTEKAWERRTEQEKPQPSHLLREGDIGRRVERYPELLDFYNRHDRFTVTDKNRNEYDAMLKGLQPWQREVLASGKTIYAISLSNLGGLVMPVPLTIVYADGSSEQYRLDQMIWRRDPRQATYFLMRDKPIVSVSADARHDMHDTDYANNHFPRRIEEDRINVQGRPGRDNNLMRDMKVERRTSQEEETENP